MDKMKPCSFCGSTKQMLLSPTCTKSSPYDPNDRAFPMIRCGGCYTDVPGKDWDTGGATAVERWNNRIADTAIAYIRTRIETGHFRSDYQRGELKACEEIEKAMNGGGE